MRLSVCVCLWLFVFACGCSWLLVVAVLAYECLQFFFNGVGWMFFFSCGY